MALAGSTRRSVRGGERRWGALRVPLSQGPFLGAGARAVVGMQATLSDVVVAPFVWSDGTCDFCHEGLHTFCRHGGLWARDGIDGGQGKRCASHGPGHARQAASGRGRRAAPIAADAVRRLLQRPPLRRQGRRRCAGDRHGDRRRRRRALSAVLAAKRLGAERNILMGRHADRTDRDALWADDIGEPVEQASAQQWEASRAIQWDAARQLDDDTERAVAQVMTFMAQNEYAALYLPAGFLPHVNHSSPSSCCGSARTCTTKPGTSTCSPSAPWPAGRPATRAPRPSSRCARCSRSTTSPPPPCC